MLRKNTNLATLIILVAILSACYKVAHTRYESPTISYQFDEPREYCQRELSENGLRMQCKEGSINIRFITAETSTSPIDLINWQYAIRDEDAYEELEGKRSKITLLTRDVVSQDRAITPSYIAVLPMGNSTFVLAEGFPVNGDEEKFESVFKNLVASFEAHP